MRLDIQDVIAAIGPAPFFLGVWAIYFEHNAYPVEGDSSAQGVVRWTAEARSSSWSTEKVNQPDSANVMFAPDSSALRGHD